VVQIILSGAHRHSSDTRTDMPTFGSAYSDAEIASARQLRHRPIRRAASAVTAENIATLRAQD